MHRNKAKLRPIIFFSRRCCYDIVEEARGRTKKNMEEKRRRLKKEAAAKGQDPEKVVVSFRAKISSLWQILMITNGSIPGQLAQWLAILAYRPS